MKKTLFIIFTCSLNLLYANDIMSTSVDLAKEAKEITKSMTSSVKISNSEFTSNVDSDWSVAENAGIRIKATKVDISNSKLKNKVTLKKSVIGNGGIDIGDK